MDPYARLAHHVRNDVLPSTRSLSPPGRLAHILDAAINDPRFGISPKLLKDVVYIVLNHPPIGLRSRERHFVAALNWSNVQHHASATVEYLRHASFDDQAADTTQSCELIFYRNAPSPGLRTAATKLWARNWTRYWNTTLGGLPSGRYTWNQLLLQEGSRPFPLGISWSRAPKERESSPYFPLTASVANRIGLPSPSSRHWLRTLMSLSSDALDRSTRDHPHIRELSDLTEAFDAIFRTIERRPTDAIPWAIFHLMRDYAVWGGKAFLSIPILIGTPAISRNAVLSLCTLDPLKSTEIREWQLVASAIFRPLVEEELAEAVAHLDIADVAFDVAHYLTDRTKPMTSVLGQLRQSIDSGAPRKELQALFSVANTCWEALMGGSILLNLHARAIRSGLKERSFLHKPEEWTSTDTYDVLAKLRTFSAWSQPATRNQSTTIHATPGLVISIVPWIAENSCRPDDVFYDSILLELVINAASHANERSGPVIISVRCEEALSVSRQQYTDGACALVLSNVCATPEGIRYLAIEPDKWQRWNCGGHGGLPHLSRLCDATGISNGLFVRVLTVEHDRPDCIRFEVAIPFMGLRCHCS